MKSRLLIILGIIFSSGIIIANAYAVPYISSESNFENSKYVLVGKILSVEILSQPVVQKAENIYSEHYGFALYEIEVKKYLKNPISNSTIQILGQYTNERLSVTYVTKPYEVEQTVLLYIQEENNIHGYDLIIRSSGSKVIDDTNNLNCKKVGCSVMITGNPLNPSSQDIFFAYLANNMFHLGKDVTINFTFLLVMIGGAIIVSVFVIRRKRK